MELINSPVREQDRKWRVELLKQMLYATKNNLPTTAATIGKMTRQLDERIKHHDYSKEDAWYYKEKEHGIK